LALAVCSLSLGAARRFFSAGPAVSAARPMKGVRFMCTRVIWPDADDSVIVGRNMDFHQDLGTNLWTQPRGIARDDGVRGKLAWTSTYGGLVATAFDLISVDGLNEAGLAGHVLWLAEASYGSRDDSRTQLSQAVWLQYFLDNFATVAEAVDWIRETD